MSDKGTIRERLRQRRRQLSDVRQTEASAAICHRLEQWRPAAEVDAIAGYLSFENEVDVSAFLEERLAASVTVALPRVEDGESMEYVEVDALDAVEEGSFGILEPVGASCAIDQLELFLVPGVGFDRTGRRIGMGWGYYDRALAARRAAGSEATFVGVCYEWQLVDGPLPSEPHDVDMDVVVTENELLVAPGDRVDD